MQHVDLDFTTWNKAPKVSVQIVRYRKTKSFGHVHGSLFFFLFCACMPVGSPLRAQGVKPTLLRNHPTIEVQKLGK